MSNYESTWKTDRRKVWFLSNVKVMNDIDSFIATKGMEDINSLDLKSSFFDKMVKFVKFLIFQCLQPKNV
jgi:hypothetical protein